MRPRVINDQGRMWSVVMPPCVLPPLFWANTHRGAHSPGVRRLFLVAGDVVSFRQGSSVCGHSPRGAGGFPCLGAALSARQRYGQKQTTA